ncbi:MAG: hydrogenase iron-sulfur subunit [Caldicoprobacterales bacterium]|jgi:formate hydrogenlyase subunit 6/NADH:ubiquinone oxidoreductase subunit I
MNVAVIGKSRINPFLTDQLKAKGFEAVLFEDIDSIKGFEGQKGKFLIKTNEEKIEAGYIILTQQAEWVSPKLSPKLACSPYSLLDISQKETGDFIKDHGRPVVIVLDYPAESAAVMTSIALEKGLALAAKKKRVFFLARFLRTAGEKLEKLYREARNSGITFIKYKKLSFDYNDHNGICTVKVWDDYGMISIDTGALIMGDSIVPGSKIDKIAELMRLRRDDTGFIGGDNTWIYPTSTNIKGIYVINNICGIPLRDDALSQIAYTISAIKKEMKEPASHRYVEVDASKCAFCYTCWRICPHAAMTPDFDKEEPVMKNLNKACNLCGICVSLCPAGAITITGNLDEKLEQVDSLSKTSDSKTLKILCCEKSAKIALDKIKDIYSRSFEQMDVSAVSCGGEVKAAKIISLLKQYEKVLVAVCVDDACKHFDGNKRAYKQVVRACELLKAAGLDENRVQYIKVSHAMPRVMADTISEIL